MATSVKIGKEQKELCRMITPEFRVSYPHLFKAQAPKGSDKLKYSITMLFPKDTDLTGSDVQGKPLKLQTVITNAKNAAYGSKDQWPAGLLSPVTDGDDPKFADKDGYAGHWVIKASSMEDNRPGVVDTDMTPLTESSSIYPGCYARAYIFAYAWEYMGKKGVSFILDHVQKTRDGKAFGGRKPVEQVFAPLGGTPMSTIDESEDHDFK